MQKKTQPASIAGNIKGLYVHIPFCDGKCHYCAFYSLPYDSRMAGQYLRALETEFNQYPRLKPETIYFGGGTPSLLSIPELDFLCSLVKENVSTENLKEWTVECNPRSLTPEKLSLLAKAGVNRISLGAQSFDDSALKWLGRRHNAADIHDAARMIKNAGFDNFGLDLIACIPGFKPDAWRKTISAAIGLKPKHISVYALTREEGTRLANSVSKEQAKPLTDDEELEMLDIAVQSLAGKNYQRYEISNFAQPGFECLHNLSCWRGEEYIGLGPAASSHAGLKRWTNLPDLEKYLVALERGEKPPRSIDVLTAKLKRVEKVVFGLRMAEGVSEATAAIRAKTLLALSLEGLATKKAGRWQLTERGFNLADYVGAEILSGAD